MMEQGGHEFCIISRSATKREITKIYVGCLPSHYICEYVVPMRAKRHIGTFGRSGFS